MAPASKIAPTAAPVDLFMCVRPWDLRVRLDYVRSRALGDAKDVMKDWRPGESPRKMQDELARWWTEV